MYMLLAVSIQTQKKPASWVVGGGCDFHKAGGKEQMGYLGRNTSVLQQLSRHEFFRLHLNEMPSSPGEKQWCTCLVHDRVCRSTTRNLHNCCCSSQCTSDVFKFDTSGKPAAGGKRELYIKIHPHFVVRAW